MARVIKAFDGVPDGAVQPRRFSPGDEVFGDLARAAIAEGWAVETAAGDHAPETGPVIPRKRGLRG